MMNKLNPFLKLIPVFGTILFVALYIIATLYYPGGSQTDIHSTGFSWTNNYWCTLLSENAINGQPNPARPIAMTGMLVLCLTLSFFWIQLPKYLRVAKWMKYIIQISGTLAMVVAFFLYTFIDHDLITNIASFLGLIAISCTLAGLYSNKWYGLFAFGLVNLIFVGLNNYFYRTEGMLMYLPVVQKISFASFLIWICAIDIHLFRKLSITVNFQ
ncbi:MAG: hypothetical protein WBP41_09865 [Saprospiraceae bacterium]